MIDRELIDLDHIRTHAEELLREFEARVATDEDGDWGLTWKHGGWTLAGGQLPREIAMAEGALFCHLWLTGVSLPLVGDLVVKAFR
jgi:hypothetical protein